MRRRKRSGHSERKEILNYCVARFKERFDELANLLCIEAGKPIRDARGEVTRLIDTFEIAAEESVRLNGEVMNLEISPRAKGYRGIYQRVPVGVCSLITPFNFPLNLVGTKSLRRLRRAVLSFSSQLRKHHLALF